MNAYEMMNEIKNCEVLKKELNGILQDLLEDGQVTATPFVKEQLTIDLIQRYYLARKRRRKKMSKKVVKVKHVDMDDRLRAEGKYLLKVRGRVSLCEFDPRYSKDKEVYLDLCDFTTDQIGYLVGVFDAIFDECGLTSISGLQIVSSEDVEKEIKHEIN